MHEFIQAAVKQLGIDEGVASKATAGVLGFAKSKLDGGDFSELASRIPGLSDLADADSNSDDSADGGGLLGGVINMASSALGGDTGDALGLASKLTGAGLDLDQFGSFGTMLIDFIKDKAGEDVVDKILEQIPDLKKLVG